MNPTTQLEAQPTERRGRLAWLPILLLLAAIIAARVAGLSESYKADTLRLVLSFMFYTLVSLGTLFLIGRSFLTSGSPGLLLLECGVILWSLAGTVGDFVSHGDANIDVTVFNVGILLAGLCHLGGAIFALNPQRVLRRKAAWLGVGCAAALGAIWLVSRATLSHWLPVFFIPGQGGTMVRHAVLISAIAMFVLSAGVLHANRHTVRLPFTYWYKLALVSLAVGLFGIMIQLSLGSVVNWLSRTAQWLGGLYLLFAALASLRESNLPLFPVEKKSHPAYYRDAVAVAVVFSAAAIRLAFLSVLGTHSPFLVFYPAVMFAAIYGGLRPGLLATGVSAILAVYFWIEPVNQWAIAQPSGWIATAIFLISGGMIAWVTESMHRARSRAFAAETQALLAAEFRRQNKIQDAINRIFEKALTCDTEEELGRICLSAVEELTGSKFSFIGEIGSDGYLHDIAISDPGWELCTMYDKTGHRRPPGNFKIHGLYGRVLLEGRSLLVNDPSSHPDSIGTPEGHPQLTAFLGVPFVQRERTIGMVAAGNRELGYTQEQQQDLEAVVPAIFQALLRKRTEEALRESEAKAKALIKYAPTGIYEIDYRVPSFISLNEAMCQILGYTREELFSMGPSGLLDDESRALFADRVRRQLAGEKIGESAEFRVRKKDGSLIDAILNVSFNVGSEPNRALVVAYDITERKRLEEELRDHVRLLDDVIDGSTSPIFLKDKEGKFITINAALERMLGKSRQELKGKTDYDIVPKELADYWRSHDARVMATGKAIQIEEIADLSDGHHIFLANKFPLVDAHGQVYGVGAISHDITERKRAEEALQKNKERFEILSETVSQLLGTDELQSVVNELCQKIMTFLDCHAFFNYLVDEEKGRLHLNAYAGIPKEAGKEIEWLDYGVAVCGCAARDACRLVMEDILNTPDVRTELVKSFGIKAYACHPLISAGRVIGTLSFGTRSRTTFTEEELSLMKTVADRVTIAMERIRLIEALRKSRDELEMRVQERTQELAAINEELRAENEERLRVEIDLRESENRLRELSSALLNAQERERKLIAGEIHDSLGASLAATKFKVESALNEMGNGNPKTKAALQSVIPILQGTIEETRRIQQSLRPSMLDDLGILTTISWFLRQYESIYSAIHIKKEIDIQEQEVPESLKIVIYRVLQEALNNIAKHSKASVVLVYLRKAEKAIQLIVRDSGQGFDLEEATSRKGSAKGLGLDSMRERAELSGGFFSIESRKGAGTVIRTTWPLDT